jgi:hypothetical protein
MEATVRRRYIPSDSRRVLRAISTRLRDLHSRSTIVHAAEVVIGFPERIQFVGLEFI